MTCSYDVIEVKIAFPRTAVRFLRVFGLKNSVKLSTSGLVDLAVIELKFNQETLTSKAILYSKIEFLSQRALVHLSFTSRDLPSQLPAYVLCFTSNKEIFHSLSDYFPCYSFIVHVILV